MDREEKLTIQQNRLALLQVISALLEINSALLAILKENKNESLNHMENIHKRVDAAIAALGVEEDGRAEP